MSNVINWLDMLILDTLQTLVLGLVKNETLTPALQEKVWDQVTEHYEYLKLSPAGRNKLAGYIHGVFDTMKQVTGDER